MGLQFDKIALSIGVSAIAFFATGNVIMGVINANNPKDNGPEVEVQVEEKVVEEAEKKSIPYETKTVEDDSIEYGKTVVRTKGVNGEKTCTYTVKYRDGEMVSKKPKEETITKQPVTEVIAKGTKVVWHCSDATSYDRNPNNDNLCESNTGEKRYVNDCEAVRLDPDYYPPQYGAPRYNGCAR